MDHLKHKTQPDDSAQAPPRAWGLREPELASFQGTGPGKVATLSQSRSCELRGCPLDGALKGKKGVFTSVIPTFSIVADTQWDALEGFLV